MTDPLSYLHQAHDEAKSLARALPPPPWHWVYYPRPNIYTALESVDGQTVLRSTSSTGAPSHVEMHPAFDRYLPDPDRVLARVIAERKILAGHLQVRLITHEANWRAACGTCLHNWPCLTITALAEGWGWEEKK